MNKKKILITGASGFVGNRLKFFFDLDAYEILTTDRCGDVEYRGDLSISDFVNQLPEVDIVVNCAAVQYVSNDLPFFFRKTYFYKNNVVAMGNLIRRYSGKAEHFVHLGTSMLYKQDQFGEYKTDSPYGSQGLYSASKIEQQNILKAFNGIASTIVPCIVGGPGRKGLFVSFYQMIRRSRYVLVPGSGDKKICAVHVDDLCKLIQIVVTKKAAGIFNAAGSHPLTIRNWVDLIAEYKQKHIVAQHIPIIAIRCIAFLTRYRFLSEEQVLMLRYPHVLDTSTSAKIGWSPLYKNSEVILDTIKAIESLEGSLNVKN